MSDQIKVSPHKQNQAKSNGQEAAFSRPDTENTCDHRGLSKREYMASAALAGILGYTGVIHYDESKVEVVAAAVELADLLLIQLEATR